jgi:uncharacterized membrane protein YraQ (UPF0718 family)
MIAQLQAILESVLAALLHVWPYLLLTIPLAVVVQMSGASRTINRAFRGRPLVAILLATAVGAFSPFCSCGVIPVIAALLIGGVPLAPVMSFWIASPSMDPEAFFLSVATLGWELAVWRLAATLVLSLAAGLLTHLLQQKGWLDHETLRAWSAAQKTDLRSRVKLGWQRLRQTIVPSHALRFAVGSAAPVLETRCCSPVGAGVLEGQSAIPSPTTDSGCGRSCSHSLPSACGDACATPAPFWRRLLKETSSATLMVVKFMGLAFLIDALIKLYVPQEWVAGLLGRQNPWAILTAALLGVPAYASNMTALPMVGGLLAQGMDPAAALAFLIAGPTTTLPAMAAVRGLTSRRVFALYVSFALVGAVGLGYVYSLAMVLF